MNSLKQLLTNFDEVSAAGLATGLNMSVASAIMSMQFLGKANSRFRLWLVIGNFLCIIDSTVEVEVIGLVLLGSYNKCLPFSSANSAAYAHSADELHQTLIIFISLITNI